MLDGDRAYIAYGTHDARHGGLRALDLATGDVIWETRLRSRPSGPPALGQHMIIADSNAEVLALDLSHGGIRWRAPTPSTVAGQPTIQSDAIYISRHDGHIDRMDMADGGTVWSLDVGGAATGQMCQTDSGIVLGTADGRIIGLGRDDCAHHDTAEGQGDQLLATGLPDHLVVTTDRRIWINGGCLWDQQGDDITVVDGSDLIGFIASGGRAAIAWRTPQGLRVTDAASPDRRSIPGARGSTSASTGRSSITASSAESSSSRLERRIGFLWAPRMRDPRPGWPAPGHVGRRCRRLHVQDGWTARLSGGLPAPVEEWTTSPHGAAVFSTPSGVFGMASNGPLHPLPPVDISSVVFSPDGDLMTAATDEGVIRWNLVRQQEDGLILGRFYPSGYTTEPVLLDEDVGTLRTWSGAIIGTGFTPCAASTHAGRLYGPGGQPGPWIQDVASGRIARWLGLT